MDVTLLLLLLLEEVVVVIVLLVVVIVVVVAAGPKANNRSQANTLMTTDVPWKNMENSYAGSVGVCKHSASQLVDLGALYGVSGVRGEYKGP
jgi:hypothetical protein